MTSGHSSQSGTSTTRKRFRVELVERDSGCVMTGITQSDEMYIIIIIPYARQDVVNLHPIQSQKFKHTPLSGSG
jgi:hypothetical protein